MKAITNKRENTVLVIALKVFLAVGLIVPQLAFSQSQNQILRVGQVVPDHQFNKILNQPNKSVRLSDYRGKWLVVDLWARYCVACIANFPHINRMSQEFKSQVDFLVVGLYDGKKSQGHKLSNEQLTKNLFDYHQKKHNLTFTATMDSSIANKFGVEVIPLILIVNPAGILVAKTYSLDSESLARLIKGDKVSLPYVSTAGDSTGKKLYNPKLPLLTTGSDSNGGVDTSFLYRSMITRFQPGKADEHSLNGWDSLSNTKRNGLAEATGMDLVRLLRLGCFGKTDWLYTDKGYEKISLNPVIETQNTMPLKDRSFLLSYSLKMGGAAGNVGFFRKALIEDVSRTFGYKITVEDRQVPVYKVIVSDYKKALRLKTSGGRSAVWVFESPIGFHLVNRSSSSLIFDTGIYSGISLHSLATNGGIPPIIDDTGINYKIDFKFFGDWVDYDVILRNLNKYGLSIIEDKVIMKCIIVADQN